jgi:hypothetical protein
VTGTYTQCPKCGHKFAQPLPASASCPACGLYFFKWGQPARKPEADEEPVRGGAGLIETPLRPHEEMDSLSFYGRIAALALLAVWGWFLFGYDYRTAEINDSFLHNIVLPIHEAGHVLFIPFGEFLTILGGSLLQLALPLGIGIAFILKNRDNFGAAVCLWWTGASLVDLSAYIYDSLHPQMLLLGGHTGEDGPHDWIYLLDTLGQLQRAQGWGAFAHVLGGLIMLAALIWGTLVLSRQRRKLD